MATLSKIRSHGVLLLVIVGLAMLAFILGDFLNSGSSFFSRSRENIAVISGHDVNFRDFEKSKEELTEFLKMQNININDELAQQQIRSQVWQMFLLEYTLGEEAKTIGLDVTSEDSRKQITNHVYQIKQTFKDPAQTQAFISNHDYWSTFNRQVYFTLLQKKYEALVKGLIRVNSLDAKFAFNARQADVNVEYVFKPYYMVADSLVTVSSADIKKLYKQHKPEYKQEPTRSIEYICFDIVPSESDYKEAEAFMKSLQEEFKTTDNIATLVNPNSDIPFNGQDYSEETIPAQYKDFAFAKGAKAGQVTELLFNNDVYSMARIMKAGYSLPDSVELKLIATEEGQEDEYIGWIQADGLRKEIVEPAFNGKKGTRFTVNLGLGTPTFEILDISKATPKVQLAILERKVIPSSNTIGTIYNKVNQFIIDNNTEAAFTAAAKEQNITILPQYNLTKSSESVGYLTDSRQIIRWAFGAKEGQVSESFRCGNVYVVAVLTEANDNEYRTIEDQGIRDMLTLEATNNKKAQLIMSEAKGVQSLAEAAELFGAEIQTAEHINLASYRFGSNGPEPAVIGAAMTMADNTVSEPIQGNLGVYVIKTGVKVVATNEIDVEAEKNQLTQRNAYRVLQQAMMPIMANAKITDNRTNFY